MKMLCIEDVCVQLIFQRKYSLFSYGFLNLFFPSTFEAVKFLIVIKSISLVKDKLASVSIFRKVQVHLVYVGKFKLCA